ncbi:MAG TPA: hypothetical protein PKK06_17145 [Phycisphaerae bacterium]|nr:hypothetical protein [Phycisphaerae bacterium]HNU46890.1 hypothetical protein [Phycisphaerae bacterium]
MLADAINFPLVAAAGLVVFGPLVVLVTSVEWLVFRYAVAVSARGVFRRLLWANVLSTLAGGIVAMFQNTVIEASGIEVSIPAFAKGYWWLALVLILIHFAKTLLVEGPVVATRGFARLLARSRRQILKGVVLANIASYCIVGPLFYLATRPTFGHLELRDDTSWTANPAVPVYFIANDDRFIKRINMDGTGLATVVPFPTAAFLISEDQSTFAYRGVDGNLYAYREGAERPSLVWQTTERFHLDGVSVSPDNTMVAFAAERPGRGTESDGCELRLFDLQRGETHTVTGCQLGDFLPYVSWSRSGEFIYAEQGENRVVVVRGRPPWNVVEVRSLDTLAPSEFPLNYVRSSSGWYAGGDDWGPALWEDSKNRDEVQCFPGLGAHFVVTRDDAQIMRVADGYGLMKLGRYYPRSPTFLPAGTEVLLEWWGQLYLLDIDQRRLGFLAEGGNYVAPLERFRVNRRR